jgi:hypothetical protein
MIRKLFSRAGDANSAIENRTVAHAPCAARGPGNVLCDDNQELWRHSLELWVQWHQANESLTAAMFACRDDSARQAAIVEELDQLDQLKWRAIELSQELLQQQRSA